MLPLSGSRTRLCDGRTRRDVLKLGSLALGGLSLNQLLAAESLSGRKSAKAVIMMSRLCHVLAVNTTEVLT